MRYTSSSAYFETEIDAIRKLNEMGLQVADHVGAILSYWDSNEVCRFANNAFRDWFGKSRDEMIGKTMKELLGPDYERNEYLVSGVLSGKTQVFERKILLPSGGVRYFLATYSPDFHEDKVTGFYIHGADITHIKKLEKEIMASELKFRGLLETAPDAMIIVNDQGIIQLANQQCTLIFGYMKSEIEGQPAEILMPIGAKLIQPGKYNEFFANPGVRQMSSGLKLTGRKKSGEEFPVEITLSPLETSEGLLISAAIRDISWNVEKERELLLSLDVIRDQNKRLMNFAHIVTHNLKTYSGNLESVLTLFINAQTDDERNEMLGYLKHISSGFTGTVKNLTDIVAVQAKENMQRELINLKNLIDHCVESLAVDVKKTGALMINNVPADANLFYNPAYLDSIILNFMTNAIKYRHPGRNPVVTMDAQMAGDKLVFKIQDNGMGIDLDKHGSKLFGMYNTFHRNADAKGIGLYITKYQVESMGGCIEVESEVGFGTTFRVFFPIVKLPE